MIGKKVIYSGRVQGVGFRNSAAKIALGFEIAGFVRNLSDGSVEIQVEGEAPVVAAFLGTLGQKMRSNIEQTKTLDQKVQGFAGFTIKR